MFSKHTPCHFVFIYIELKIKHRTKNKYMCVPFDYFDDSKGKSATCTTCGTTF